MSVYSVSHFRAAFLNWWAMTQKWVAEMFKYVCMYICCCFLITFILQDTHSNSIILDDLLTRHNRKWTSVYFVG